MDAGVSCRALTQALEARQILPEKLRGIFITHEHVDHVRGLKVFLKKYSIPVYATAATLEYLSQNDLVPATAQLEVMDEKGVAFANLQVTCFSTPHDAADSVGYRIQLGDDRLIGVATDLGHVSDTVRQGITGCDLVLLESNYDTGMLRCSSYPYPLKQRIASQNGHLSNDCCADEINRLIERGSTRFVLAHLSKENNMPSLAYQTISSALERNGYQKGRDFTLEVAPRCQPGEMTIF